MSEEAACEIVLRNHLGWEEEEESEQEVLHRLHLSSRLSLFFSPVNTSRKHSNILLHYLVDQ